MNIEEKIAKKEKRRKTIKKVILPIIIILIVIIIAIISLYFLMPRQETQDISNETTSVNNFENEAITEQTVGVEIKENTFSYNGYIYEAYFDYESFKVVVDRYNENESEDKVEVLSFMPESGGLEGFWIYNNRMYLIVENKVKSFNLEGTDEKSILENSYFRASQLDLDNQLLYFFYEEGIGIAGLDGEIKIKIPIQEKNGNKKIIGSDEKYIYYAVTFYDEQETTLDAQVLITIYSVNKETQKEIKLAENSTYSGSSYGIYNFVSYGDYVYYSVGAQDGGMLAYYGKICCVKKDGTDYTELAIASGEFGYTPDLIIYDGYLYFDDYRVNLKNNEVSKDTFSMGDKIDEDGYVYTASLTDGKSFNIAKYKAGTDYEGLERLFSKEIKEGYTVDSYRVDINMEGEYVYFTIEYSDYKAETWKPIQADTETYKMKKDGSELQQID